MATDGKSGILGVMECKRHWIAYEFVQMIFNKMYKFYKLTTQFVLMS